MDSFLSLSFAFLCASVRSPSDLETVYRLQSEQLAEVAVQYGQLAGEFERLANQAAIVEEFASNHMTTGTYLAVSFLDIKTGLLREESIRLTAEADDLLERANHVAERYYGTNRFRVRAMRRECLATLPPSS